MNLALQPPSSLQWFAAASPEDVPDIVALGHEFYAESELAEMTPFNPVNLEKVVSFGLEHGHMRGFTFREKDALTGFILYTLDRSYTEDPLGLIWLLYVTPALRASPAGRLLLGMAEHDAREQGAVALYGGTMAGIDGVEQTLPNLYRRRGYKPLFWGRKLLQGDD